MTQYQKYMFDNFIVEEEPDPKEENFEDTSIELSQEENIEETDTLAQDFEDITPNEDNLTSQEDILKDEIVSSDTVIEEPVIEEPILEEPVAEEPVVEELPEVLPEPEIIAEEPEEEKEVVPSFSQEELDEAVKQASSEGYNQGYKTATDEHNNATNILLENISNQLSEIYNNLEQKVTEIEQSSIEFSVSLVKKLLPTLEKDQAKKEIEKFLNDNFPNFSNQEMLSFSFSPDSINLIADSIGKIAEKNDFEGKISVHKNDNLSLSECKVEWKNGGVERRTSKLLNKVENLISNISKERNNG